LFRDPTLGSDTATAVFGFAPADHGEFEQTVAITSDAGSQSVELSGRGVGPQYASAAAIEFDPVAGGATATHDLSVSNATGDGDLGLLTDLSLLSVEIVGPDAARFSMVDFDPQVLAAGGSVTLEVAFDAAGALPGSYAAELRITTDQGAAYAAAGQTFTIALTAEVVPSAGASVVGRMIFYNHSKFDGGTPGADASDDLAIAVDKSAYLPGSGAATFAHITSYSRGINGIMIDVAQAAGPLAVDDFRFHVSSQAAANNMPSLWEPAPAPETVTVRPGAGSGGADRVEILWADGAIVNRWLQVVVEGDDAAGGFNTNTGLVESDLFYFGSRVGDVGSGTPTLAVTSALDELAVRGNFGAGAGVTNLFDFDRNGLVSALDAILVRGNIGTLTKINVGDPPAAPQGVALAPSAEALRRPPDPQPGDAPAPQANGDAQSAVRVAAMASTAEDPWGRSLLAVVDELAAWPDLLEGLPGLSSGDDADQANPLEGFV
jgi:hypothetical protein